MTNPIRHLVLVLVLTIVCLAPSDGAKAIKNPFRSNKPFRRLDRFLQRASYSKDLGENLRLIDNYLKDFDKSNDPNNKPLTLAANQFSQLANLLDVFKELNGERNLCNLRNTNILITLQADIECDFNDKLTSNDIRLKRVVQLHRDTTVRYVSVCLAYFIDEWTQFDVDKKLFKQVEDASERAQAFELFLGEMRDWTSTNACGYKDFRIPLKELLCECQKSCKQLKDKPIWPTVQALNQLLRAKHQLNRAEVDSLRQLVSMEDSEREVIGLLDATLFEPCRFLVAENDNEPTRMLAEVPDLIKLLPDFGLVQEGAKADRVLEWSRRQLICKRLLAQTGSDQLAKQVINWVESHN